MTTLDSLYDDLSVLMSSLAASKSIKLLNVGSDCVREYHWRFRLPGGQIVVLTVEQES